MRVVTGIQPTGNLHLGNYYGAIEKCIKLSDNHDCYFFIADYHALTSVSNAEELRRKRLDMAKSWYALLKAAGFENNVNLYFQSSVPAVTELAWILNCVTPVGLMERAPAFKEKTSKGLKANMGLFSYPILMTADILSVGGELVPVGQDQLPHIDIARDIAQKFNATFGEVFKLPEPSEQANKKIPGIDGQKMSKSYGNTIDIFCQRDTLERRVAKIKTDSKSADESKVFGEDNATAILDLFLDDQLERNSVKASFESGTLGYHTIKSLIIEKHIKKFAAAIEVKNQLTEGSEFDEFMLRGADKANILVSETLHTVRQAVGLK
jgi:tryptophanyl-tRNA synthetase